MSAVTGRWIGGNLLDPEEHDKNNDRMWLIHACPRCLLPIYIPVNWHGTEFYPAPSSYTLITHRKRRHDNMTLCSFEFWELLGEEWKRKQQDLNTIEEEG